MQKRTPIRRQIDAAECGAACMGSLLQYHGRYVPPSVIRQQCEVSRDGSKAAALIRAGKHYGIESRGFRASADQLDQLTLPAVIHWRNSHFVILEGFNKRTVFINDPATGHRRFSWKQFKTRYSGIALTFSPTAFFEKGGQPPRLFQSLVARLENRGGVILYCFIAALVATVPTLFFAIGCRVFVDDCIIRGDSFSVRPLLWILLAAMVIQSLLFWIKATCLRDFRVSLKQTMSRQFLDRLMNKPVLFFTKRFTSELACRFRLNDRVAESMSHLALDSVSGLMASACYAAVLIALCPPLALVAILLISLNLVLIRSLNRSRTEMSQQLAISEGQLMGVAVETANSIEVVQATGLQEFVFKRWHHYWRETVQSRLKIETSNTHIGSFSNLSSLLASTAVIGVGSLLVIQGTTTLGTLIAFQLISPFLTQPIVKFVEAVSQLQVLMGDLAKLDDVIELENVAENAGERSDKIEKQHGLGLQAKDLCFGFQADGTGLLENVSLELPKGDWLGLAGPSGSGKSTLARLLGGVYPLTKGFLQVGDRELRKLNSAQRAEVIGYVDQESVLFPGTLRENFCFGTDQFSDKAILNVCEELNLLDMVQTFPGGLGGLVMGNGENVSGGERQRIDIARALLVNPELIILDEGTSALDHVSEQAVIDAIRKRGMTCIMVSHRVSVLKQCDRIELLRNGNQIASGSHQVLLADCAQYRTLLDSDSLGGQDE